MDTYTFPGYDDATYTAEDALQEWIDTFGEYYLDDETAEILYSFTLHGAPAWANLEAIAQGATYAGLDLDALGYPLPVRIIH